jgi:hypothetical protein
MLQFGVGEGVTDAEPVVAGVPRLAEGVELIGEYLEIWF